MRGTLNLRGLRAGMARPEFRRVNILLLIFASCSLLYYFGELVDAAGWDYLRWEYFYGIHDTQRLFFIAPIIYAAYFFKIRGAVGTTLAAFLVFLPRSLFLSTYPFPMARVTGFIFVAGVIGVLVALSRTYAERRATLEGEIRRERDKLTAILARMEEGVMIVGPDYRIRLINQTMRREFGEGEGTFCYKYLNRLSAPCPGVCRLRNVVGGAVERWDYTSLLGGRIYEVLASPYIDTDGTVCHLATFRNITQRKKVEAELIELNRLKSELVSNVSHEFKSPLTAIKGIVSTLLQKDIKWDDSTRETLLGAIGDETDRLTSLATNILNISKLESGVWRPARERCSLAEIINTVLDQQRWVHRKHSFQVQVPADFADIYADYNQVRQVLINLVENAAAYSAADSEIIISARSRDGAAEIAVTDHGVGIPESELGKIFDKFYRGGQERRRPGGTGLGLTICRALVQANSGRIWAESRAGLGSTFHFTLPLADGNR